MTTCSSLSGTCYDAVALSDNSARPNCIVHILITLIATCNIYADVHAHPSSSGFDASEYETEDMSRHGHHVPTSFYHRFTRDVCKFASRNSRDGGRIISVLEGGYSDRALISGALSHVTALADESGVTDQGWWDPKALDEVSLRSLQYLW